MLILCFDFIWHNFGDGQSKNFWLDSKQQHDPVISIRSIFNFPFLGADIPLVSTSDSRSNLFMCQRFFHLAFWKESSTWCSFFKHLFDNTWREWQLSLLDVLFNFPQVAPLIIGSVDFIAKLANTINRNLHRLVSLLEILGWSSVQAWWLEIFHA